MAKREFTVGWLAQYELIVEAENADEALEDAINRIEEGENVDYFDFHVVED